METEVRFPVLVLSPERLISLICNLLDTKQYLRRMQQTLPTNIMQALKCKRVSCGKCDTYLIQSQQSVYPVSLFHSQNEHHVYMNSFIKHFISLFHG